MSYQPKVTKDLSPAAQVLVDIYNAVPGSSGPYANPESLAEVVKALATALLMSSPEGEAEKLCSCKLFAIAEDFFQ
jgi:hypothetical protein